MAHIILIFIEETFSRTWGFHKGPQKTHQLLNKYKLVIISLSILPLEDPIGLVLIRYYFCVFCELFCFSSQGVFCVRLIPISGPFGERSRGCILGLCLNILPCT